MRAFNTRTNFVDQPSLLDTSRVRRMVKYRQRGFATLAFDVCRHERRCDVVVSRRLRNVLETEFLKQLRRSRRSEEDEETDLKAPPDSVPAWSSAYLGNDRDNEGPGLDDRDCGGDEHALGEKRKGPTAEHEDELKEYDQDNELCTIGYGPTPLLYGPKVSPFCLSSHIEDFIDERGFNGYDWFKYLRHNITSNPVSLRAEILSRCESSLLRPMCLKFDEPTEAGDDPTEATAATLR
ncbi:hypothetical protein HK101_006937 [Irineochytrium annulatum]|nr:hypothetical protein HK101_006937 [Irineochytrium annulatum]